MSLVGWSVGWASPRPSSEFKHRGFEGARLPRAQGLRVANGESGVANGESGVASGDVGLNQVAPPVGNVFGEEVREVRVLEDPMGFFKYKMERKARALKQALESVEDVVAPSPYSPVQGYDALGFVFISVLLVLAFWLGNYTMPRWIFKDTVFRNSGGRVDEAGAPDEKPSEEAVDPADLIELPTNLMPLRPLAVAGFKAGRQKARDAAKKRRKKSEKTE